MSFILENKTINREEIAIRESLYAQGNGYLGYRGNFEEGSVNDYDRREKDEAEAIDSVSGSYVNGFYDIVPLAYAEMAYGFPLTMQKMVNNIDSQKLYILLEGGERVHPLAEGVSNYYRKLDMKQGFVEHGYTYETKDQKRLNVVYRRLISFVRQECIVSQVIIEPMTYKGPIEVHSVIDGNVENYTGNSSDPRVGNAHSKLLEVTEATCIDEQTITVKVKTLASELSSQCHGYSKAIGGGPEGCWQSRSEKGLVESVYKDELIETLMIEKYIVHTDSLRHQLPIEGVEILETLKQDGSSLVFQEQQAYLDNFWKGSDITIFGEDRLMSGLRFNIFQLLQSVGKDKYSNVAAKGLSGEGYEGHYFWDTEIFIFPFFMLTNPEIGKSLLMYRYNILDDAKNRALEMGHQKGALYPWRTINGKECSSYFPAGTAQYHISGDIAYAFISYYLVTEDMPFIKDYGIDVLVETARLWLDVGHYQDGQFHIDCVTGPDEYTALVNNNYYTNGMAKYNLNWVYKLLNTIQERDPSDYHLICQRLNLSEEEVKAFAQASENMYLPYDEAKDINLQDDSFLSKKVWDFENTPKEKYPLLLHYHPLTIYRHQVLKQADVVLAHFLLEDYAQQSTIANSFDYYEKITTHDSSLSTSTYGMMACQLGDVEKAYEYFKETVRLDLDNTHKNTKDGLHMANMGGTYMYVIYGFAGLRIKDNGLSFRPLVPRDWTGYQFNLTYLGFNLNVRVRDNTVTLCYEGQPIRVTVNDQVYKVDGSLVIEL